MLEILSIHRDLEQTIEEEEKMLSQVEHNRLPSYNLGHQNGLQEGRQEGEAAMLLRLLERKYGPQAAAAYRERVQKADADTLLTGSERILTAETIGAIFE